ncbi:hypothetical protein [Brevibacillus choshinensis]|nr:hypothetical protein [Brevibacillus choshinensis]
MKTNVPNAADRETMEHQKILITIGAMSAEEQENSTMRGRSNEWLFILR